MSWEQHRYAVERARDRLKERLAEIEKANDGPLGIMLPLIAGHDDAEMLDDVADFLRSLEGSKRTDDIGDEFVAEWNKTISTISVFCDRYSLPKPDMIFHRQWKDYMSVIAGRPLGSPIIYAGVRVRFGVLESADVLRS